MASDSQANRRPSRVLAELIRRTRKTMDSHLGAGWRRIGNNTRTGRPGHLQRLFLVSGFQSGLPAGSKMMSLVARLGSSCIECFRGVSCDVGTALNLAGIFQIQGFDGGMNEANFF